MNEPERPITELHQMFSGRSVLLTGHTGFKGSWLAIWLNLLGARVTGYALAPPTEPNNFELSSVREVLVADVRGDIRDRKRISTIVRESQPDIILHLAAQTVVLDSYREPIESFDINVVGTAALLDAVRELDKRCAVVVVTSDKCYANDEKGRRFAEGDALGGHDPYSASKAGQELVAAAYRSSFFPPDDIQRHGIALATARAGNVIGGGDWTPHGIIADIVRSLGRDDPVSLRRPQAIRPWQHVLEPLSGYLTLAARLCSNEAARFCDAWNLGPNRADEATVAQLTELMITEWGHGRWVDSSRPEDLPEAGTLRLSTDRTFAELGWQPKWGVRDAVHRTVQWHRSVREDPEMARAACISDIKAYLEDPASR